MRRGTTVAVTRSRVQFRADVPTGAALGLIGLCIYEPIALVTGKVPTVSDMCRRHRALEAAFVALWFTHIHFKIKVMEEA